MHQLGAYYAAQSIEFDKGNAYEVLGERELGFFPGLCVGPTYPGFVYDSECGARNVELELSLSPVSSETSAQAYWNGGGAFADAASHKSVKVLARYAGISGNDAAAIVCQVGKGSVLLSASKSQMFTQNRSLSLLNSTS